MKRTLLLALSVTLLTLTAQAQPTPNAWINEIHYDNDGADTGQFLELVLEDAGDYDLSDFAVEFYDDDGDQDEDVSLGSFASSSTDGSFTIYEVQTDLENSTEGIALCYQESTLIQFLSYEGNFTASGGCADGMASTDIGVSESSSTPIGESLQLTGTGSVYSDFTWAGPATDSPGAVNDGQSLSSDPDANCNSIAGLQKFFESDDVVKYEWDEEDGAFVLADGSSGDVIEIIDIEYKLDEDGEPILNEPVAVTWSIKDGSTVYAVSGVAVKVGEPCPSEDGLVEYGGDPVTVGGTLEVDPSGTAISYIAFGIVPLENECKSTIIASLDNSTGEVTFDNSNGITELYFHLPNVDGLPDPDEPAIEGLLIDNVTGLSQVPDPDFEYYYGASGGTDPSEVVITFKDDPTTDDPQRFFLVAYSDGTTRAQEADDESACRTIIDPPFPMEQAVTRFAVEGSYPNPFTSSTTIRFDLPEPADVSLTVYNIMGQKVAQLVDGHLPAGPHAVDWNGRSDGGARLSSGLYFYRLAAGDRTGVQRVTLVR